MISTSTLMASGLSFILKTKAVFFFFLCLQKSPLLSPLHFTYLLFFTEEEEEEEEDVEVYTHISSVVAWE